jgi:hypothetical protein
MANRQTIQNERHVKCPQIFDMPTNIVRDFFLASNKTLESGFVIFTSLPVTSAGP